MRSVVAVLIASLVLFSGCTKDSSDSNHVEDSSNELDSSTTTTSVLVKCGVYSDSQFHSVVPFENAEVVKVQALGPDIVIITRTSGDQAGNEQLVKLQGITASGISSGKVKRAIDLIENVASYNALFLPAGDSCSVTLAGGGAGVYGHIFTSDGKSLNELLIQKGLALPEAGICGGNDLAGCYAGLPVEEEFSNQVISHVLWKPVSENDGKLVLLHNAFQVNASVEGAISSMAGSNTGPSNGYGSTVRYPYAGCAYGKATVKFYDSLDRVVPLANGETSLVINNGCDRTELHF